MQIKDEFINRSNDLLTSIKITPIKNENLKFKYPPKKTKETFLIIDYINMNKQRNKRRYSLYPK